MQDVTVLIPAYNEAQRIKRTLSSLKKAGLEDILVIDDGSVDKTAYLAEEEGAQVLRLGLNVGKGEAINKACALLKKEYVLLLDADLQESASQAVLLIEPVKKEEADITVAKFSHIKSGRGFGIAKRIASWGIIILTGKKMQAPLSGQRCMKTKVLKELLPFAPRFGIEVGMTIDALKKGYTLLEVESELEHCPPGRNWRGILHRGRQFWDISRAISSRMWRC